MHSNAGVTTDSVEGCPEQRLGVAHRISNFGLALKSHTFTLAPWKKGLHLETLPHLNRGQRPYSPLSWWPFKQNQSTACSRALSMKHSITELTSSTEKILRLRQKSIRSCQSSLPNSSWPVQLTKMISSPSLHECFRGMWSNRRGVCR